MFKYISFWEVNIVPEKKNGVKESGILHWETGKWLDANIYRKEAFFCTVLSGIFPVLNRYTRLIQFRFPARNPPGTGT